MVCSARAAGRAGGRYRRLFRSAAAVDVLSGANRTARRRARRRRWRRCARTRRRRWRAPAWQTRLPSSWGRVRRRTRKSGTPSRGTTAGAPSCAIRRGRWGVGRSSCAGAEKMPTALLLRTNTIGVIYNEGEKRARLDIAIGCRLVLEYRIFKKRP
eukprot:54794-Prorocentrum_minimum.AAC.1